MNRPPTINGLRWRSLETFSLGRTIGFPRCDFLVILVYFGLISAYFGLVSVNYVLISVYFGLISVNYGLISVYFGLIWACPRRWYKPMVKCGRLKGWCVEYADFFIKNDELCIKNDGLCTKNDESCIKTIILY